MTFPSPVSAGLLAAALLAPILGCSRGPSPDANQSPVLEVDALANLTYRGTQSGTVSLRDGLWQGPPYQPGAASRPQIELATVDPTRGDVNGDGTEDAVVILSEQLGGTGIFVYLAVVVRRSDRLENVATALLGDRVGVIALAIDEGRVVADLAIAGENDPACCPTRAFRVTWRLEGDVLREVARRDQGRLEY